MNLHLWSYAHLPLYLGIAVAGVGLQHLVRSADMSVPAGVELVILSAAFTVVVTSMSGLMLMRAPEGRVQA